MRSGSCVLPLHDPVRVAEEWSMIDNLSEGRVELSIASGWHPNDFVLAPECYKERHAVMREKIQTLKSLWRGESLTRKNGVGQDFEFFVHPKPIQKELQLWVTAAGSVDTFKYAGEIGANVLTHLLGQSIEDLDEKIKAYRIALKENGFDSNKGRVALMMHTFVSDDIDYVKEHVEIPFKNYLKSSANLMKPLAEEKELDMQNDMDALLDAGFNRFFKTSSLFGTPESCWQIVNKIHKIGVDEIACLIDFGVEEEIVLDNFNHLERLRDLIHRSKCQYDYIINRTSQLDEEQFTTPLIDKFNISHLQSTPSFFEELLLQNKGSETVKNLDTLLVGGEALSQSLANKLLSVRKGPIHNMYGPTETTIWSSIKTIEEGDSVNIGSPIANTQIYILDRFNKLCPIGVPGELCIAGLGVAAGYLNRQDLTDERFVENPFDKKQKNYKTGDLAKWLPNGELEFLGRLDRQVKVNGHRIELNEIEKVVLEIPEVVQAVVSTFSKNDHTFLSAYIISENKSVTDTHVKDFIRLRLPSYMIPENVIFLDEFPQTPNGKIDVKKLPRPDQAKEVKENYVAPRNKLEKDMCAIWAKSLGLEKVGIDDNYFEIGGNSLRAFQLLSTINSELKLEVKIISFFQFPTIRLFVENIQTSGLNSSGVEIEEKEMEDVDDILSFMENV